MADFRKNGCSDACFFVVVILVLVTVAGVKSDSTCDPEIEEALHKLLSPDANPSIQLLSLRRNFARKLQEALKNAEEEDEQNYKRSISSLAAWGNLPTKRNLEALARAGYIKTLPDDKEDENPNNDSNYKRSLAALAKNDQLPNQQEQKRGIESLARNGELLRRKNIQDMLDELYAKRNVGSLARNFNFPSYGKRFVGALARNGDLNYQYKRNVAALARDGWRLPSKRNVAAMLRQDSYMNSQQGDVGRTDIPPDTEKRNIASIKAQYEPKFKRAAVRGGRNKRDVGFDDDDSDEYEYDDYVDEKGLDEKRFLGRLPQMGKSKTTPSPRTH